MVFRLEKPWQMGVFDFIMAFVNKKKGCDEDSRDFLEIDSEPEAVEVR